MQRHLLTLVLAACMCAPLAVSAQPAPGSDPPGPPPAVRAKIDAIMATAKNDGYAALTPDHRAQVTAIVAKVTAGALDPRAASGQIDALLTPDETTAVLAVAAKTREQIRAAFGGSMPPPPGGPPPGAAPAQSGPAPHASGDPGMPHRKMTAGGYLLRASITPEQMRALHHDGPPGPPPQ